MPLLLEEERHEKNWEEIEMETKLNSEESDKNTEKKLKMKLTILLRPTKL